MPIAECNKRLNVTLHTDMVDELEVEAKRLNLTKSDVIALALLQYLINQGGQRNESSKRVGCLC